MNHRPVIDCQDCQFYRPQASFVDAYKDFERNAPREPVMKSLLDLRKEETHVQENEMELQIELLMTEQQVWPTRPRFAPLCKCGDDLFIPIPGHPGCKHEPAVNRQGRACVTCQFLGRPETKVGDRRQMPTGAGGSQETAFYRQLNKEQDDADAMAQALEIEQSFVGDGCLPAAYFLPTCGIRVTDGRRNVAPFCNLRNDCEEHRPHITPPEPFFRWVGKTANQPDGDALKNTIKVAQLVAQRDIKRPVEFLTDLAAWVREDPSSRWSVAQWAYSCGRWALGSPGNSGAGNLPPHRPGDSLPVEWGTAPAKLPPTLLPFIAGCDAYEWGLLAAFSQEKKPETNATTAGVALCQQLAEFLVTVLSPFEAAACIDAAADLIRCEDLFSPKTIDLVDGFIQGLRGHAKMLRLVAQTDLQRHFEELASKLSYKVGVWLALAWRDPAYLARFDGIDAQVGEKVRQKDRSKLQEARAKGKELLEAFAELAAGTLSPESRGALLNKLTVENDEALERDQTDAVDVINDAVSALAKKWGLPLDLPVADNQATYRTVLMNAVRQSCGVVFDVPRATENPRRRVLATLFLRRGLDPVTPTALELYSRHPQPGRIPESIEQALTDPVAPTLEYLIRALFGLPDVTRSYLAYGRRLGTPRLQQTQ